MNILKIVISNMRKRKGANITFFVMVILAALMLSIGLSLTIGGVNFYEKKVEELKAPHFSSYIITSSYRDDDDVSFERFVKAYQGVTNIYITDAAVTTGAWKMKSVVKTNTIFILDEASIDSSFQNIKVIDKKELGNIILPLNFKTDGFRSGEKVVLDIGGKDYDFTIKGFFEDTLTGSATRGATTIYVSSSIFSGFEADDNFSLYKNITVRFDSSDNELAFCTAFDNYAKLKNNEEFRLTFAYGKSGAMMFVNILSVLLIAFSVTVLIIAFIVARFSINNTMQEDISTIGALKSIGYKSKALRFSQLLQYMLIAGIGSVSGTLISLLTFGFLGNIIASTSGLLWLSGANILPVLLSIMLICGLTAITTHSITRKYKRTTPISALQQVGSHHSFNKNIMPLSKYKMLLNLHLGIKRCLKNLKSNITLFVITMLMVFVSALVFSMSYNLNVDTSAMERMIGLEMAEVWIQTDPSVDIDELNSEVNSHGEVARTVLTGNFACVINGINFNLAVFEDYSLIKSNVYKGKYPKLDGEIALGSVAAKTLKKGLGDTVTVEIEGVSRSYSVVGLTQDIGSGGKYCNITLSAMQKHNLNFKMDTIYVYLNDGANTKSYIETLKELYGNKILMANTEEQMTAILVSLGGPFETVSAVMIAVTVIIISLVLFLLLSALIRKEKRELGIMKAMGYKNKQLILQVLISMLPSLSLGSILGASLTFALTNPLLSLIMSSMGLVSTYFIIPILATMLISLGIFGISVLTAYLICLRLKKISPQKLIVEH